MTFTRRLIDQFGLAAILSPSCGSLGYSGRVWGMPPICSCEATLSRSKATGGFHHRFELAGPEDPAAREVRSWTDGDWRLVMGPNGMGGSGTASAGIHG